MTRQFLQHLPIKRKLTLVILTASMVTLVLAFASLFALQLVRSRQQITRDLLAHAEIIAANSTAAMAFQDEGPANEILRSLKAKPHVVCARLYLPDRSLLASYGAEQDQDAFPPGTVAGGIRLEGAHLVLFQPVVQEGKRLGTLYLRFNYQAMQREIIGPYLAILAGILLASSLLALLLSSRLQRVISEPILQVAEIARAVAERKDYSVRAKCHSRDEVGILTSAFNHMLARIHEQDVALRDSEGRYRLLFERNPGPMFVYDSETLAFLAVNDAAIAHYGFQREEFLRMTIKDIRPPEDVPMLLARLAASNGTTVRVGQCRHRKQDGTVIEVETTAHRIEFFGRPASLLLALDITERITAERALEQSRQRYEVAVMGSNDGLWDWDIAANTVYFSPRWKRILGYEDEEFPNQVGLWEERLHPDDAKRVAQNLQDYLAGENPQYEAEYRLLHKDGSYRWLLSRGVALRDQLGKPFRMAGSHTDITARKQGEVALQQRYEVEKLISEMSTQFINLAAAEIDQGISRALETIGRFVGSSLAVLVRCSDDGVLANASHEWSANGVAPLRPSRQRIPTTSTVWTTLRLQHEDSVAVTDVAALPAGAETDKQFFASIGIRSFLAVPMRFGGRLTGVFGAGHVSGPRPWSDSEVTLFQLAAQIFTNALERQRAHHQMEALHDQMLEVSRKSGMAEVAAGVLHNVGNVLNSVNVSTNLVRDRLRNSRVAGVAKLAALVHGHEQDLGSFFTSDPRGKQIPGYLQQLAQLLQEEQSKLAEEIELLARNVDHIKQIISMQQSYARVSGVIETLPVSTVVEDALRITEAGLLRHGISLVRDFAEVSPIKIDRHKVLQILVNLLRNARQAIEAAGKRTGQIMLRIQAHGPEYIRIEIQDDGIGIEAGDLQRIFSHGFTTKHDGNGVGLHNGALAAHEMGGTLSVRSDGRGLGATFALDLPLSTSAGSAQSEKANAAPI